jgi:hypothetical protein
VKTRAEVAEAAYGLWRERHGHGWGPWANLTIYAQDTWTGIVTLVTEESKTDDQEERS